MGTTKDRSLERADYFTGQKSGNPPSTLKPSDCETVRNFLCKRGTLERDRGASVYGRVDGLNSIRWMSLFDFRVMCLRGSEIYLESAENSATFTPVKSISSSAPISSQLYRKEMYMFNGTEMMVYPIGGSFRNLGLHPPITDSTSVSTWTLAGGGSLTAGKTYRVTFTFIDQTNNVESPGLNVRPDIYGTYNNLVPGYFSVVLGGGDSKFTIPAATLNSLLTLQFNNQFLADTSRITHIGVYMSGPTDGVNALVFRKVTDIAVGSIAATEVSTAATGVLLPQNNSPVPSKLRQQEAYAYTKAGAFVSEYTVPTEVGQSVYTDARFFKDTLFAIGAKGTQFPEGSTSTVKYDSILYIHEPLQADYVFDTKEAGNGDGQDAIGVAILRDSVVVVFKQRSIYYVSGTSVDNYELKIMDSKRGAVAKGSIQETPYGILALDRSGVIMVGAIGPAQLISDDIEDVIETITFTDPSLICSGYDAKNSRYYLAVPVDGSDYPNLTLVYKLDEKVWSIIDSKEASAFLFGISSTNQIKNLIGSYAGGVVLDQSSEEVVTVDGAAIDSVYTSGPFYHGDPTRKKKAKFLYITAESNTDWTIDIEIIPDFGQGQPYVIEDLNSISLYSIYAASQADTTDNVGIYDQSYFSPAKVKKRLKIPILCVGYCFQVRITNSSTDADQYGFKILALELESVLLGK